MTVNSLQPNSKLGGLTGAGKVHLLFRELWLEFRSRASQDADRFKMPTKSSQETLREILER